MYIEDILVRYKDDNQRFIENEKYLNSVIDDLRDKYFEEKRVRENMKSDF